MGLVVMILMPFIGAIYIIYRLFKDDPNAFTGCASIAIMPMGGFFTSMIMIFFVGLGRTSENEQVVGAITLVLLVLGAASIPFLIFMSDRLLEKQHKKIAEEREADPDYDKKQRQKRFDRINQLMIDSGFTLEPRYIDQLLDDYRSPLNNPKSNGTTGDCYKYLYYSRELDLAGKNITELSQMLGVPFFDLPESVRSRYLLIHTIMEFEGFTFRGYRSMITVDKHGSYDELKKFLVEYQKTHPESNFNFGY